MGVGLLLGISLLLLGWLGYKEWQLEKLKRHCTQFILDTELPHEQRIALFLEAIPTLIKELHNKDLIGKLCTLQRRQNMNEKWYCVITEKCVYVHCIYNCEMMDCDWVFDKQTGERLQ